MVECRRLKAFIMVTNTGRVIQIKKGKQEITEKQHSSSLKTKNHRPWFTLSNKKWQDGEHKILISEGCGTRERAILLLEFLCQPLSQITTHCLIPNPNPKPTALRNYYYYFSTSSLAITHTHTHTHTTPTLLTFTVRQHLHGTKR